MFNEDKIQRCTNCGRHPFCTFIKDPSKPNNCKIYLKKELESNETKYKSC